MLPCVGPDMYQRNEQIYLRFEKRVSSTDPAVYWICAGVLDFLLKKYKTRKSSCVNARGILPAA